LHAIRHTKPFALKACESLVLEQNVLTEQDELLLERRCQTAIASTACALTLFTGIRESLLFSSSFEFVFVIR
jgi:hypothetical protein